MSSKLFVGGLAWATDDQRLREVFEEYGNVDDARVITDRDTGRSRGFGFVSFVNPEDAEKARAMDGTDVDGRAIRVELAKDKPRR